MNTKLTLYYCFYGSSILLMPLVISFPKVVAGTYPVSTTFSPRLINNMFWVPLPLSGPQQDGISWAPSRSGKFSMGIWYNFILKEKGVIYDSDINWDWLWKLKIPLCITTFLWTLLQNKILSNKKCVIRNISSNPFCKSCPRL